ncbi:MAG: hypothetical protein A2527_10250 [Candidatus Lambdaproteobacteria bacterium RIFOXYD2_FULL_50_16]|uniref:Uncharacterized protein n=1 Tax=Candidatus Lambdaproteobacteria bacterium RIFOXYD2_FULL_50_16 TaxID=1817772 RepID=A0A1F6GGF2_9PROT|nr:MAG: hypothetical protein A2527_10250 [Candidatus Lambdaproteobacteria bacterium RIFOXYD2_FULL_50_16]
MIAGAPALASCPPQKAPLRKLFLFATDLLSIFFLQRRCDGYVDRSNLIQSIFEVNGGLYEDALLSDFPKFYSLSGYKQDFD